MMMQTKATDMKVMRWRMSMSTANHGDAADCHKFFSQS